MNQTSALDKFKAATGGAYAGTFLATGIAMLSGLGVEGRSYAWFTWIPFSLLWGTVVSLPVGILLMFTLVRFVFNKLKKDDTPNYLHYALAGVVSGAIPILLVFGIVAIYFLTMHASYEEYLSILPPLSYFLLYGCLCGAFSLIILCRISLKNRSIKAA